MGFGNVGWSGMVLILAVLLLVFGPSKLPEIGKAFGKSLREFKSATTGMVQDASAERDMTDEPPSTATPVSVQAVNPIPLLTEEQDRETGGSPV